MFVLTIGEGWGAIMIGPWLLSPFGWFLAFADPAGYVMALLFWSAVLLTLAAPWIAARDPERASRVAAGLLPLAVTPLLIRGSAYLQAVDVSWALKAATAICLLMALGCWLLEKTHSYDSVRYPNLPD